MNETGNGVLKEALDFAVGYVTQKVPSELLGYALRLLVPRLADMADLERWDAEARLHVMATIDEGLRALSI